MGLPRYIAKRVLQMIPVIFLMIVINFTIIHMAPGDPAVIMAGERAYPELVESIRIKYNLNKPLHEQLITYLLSVIKGDLGYSLYFQRPVLTIILERIPATLFLVITAQIFSIILGVILGTYAASKKGSIADILISGSSLALFSMPVFWLGTMMIFFFGLKLRWLPTSGMMNISENLVGMPYMIDIIRHLILPVLTLTAYFMPMVLHLMKSSIEEVMGENYIITARAKGVDRKTIFRKHALRNALLPTVTLIGIMLGYALTGAVLTETVFAWPGMGRLLYDAIFSRDYPLLLGIFFFASISVSVFSLITDVVYGYVDPRIKYT